MTQNTDSKEGHAREDEHKPDFRKQLTLDEMIKMVKGGEEERRSSQVEMKKESKFLDDGKARVPGPGAHTMPSLFSEAKDKTRPIAPSFSMAGGWIEETMPEGEIGPGKYLPNENPTRPRAPVWGFGNSDPTKTKKTEPKRGGPALLHGDNINFDRSPQYGFGCIDRFKSTPGSVVLGSPLGHGIGCKMPGPGQHSIKEATTSKVPTTPTYSFASPSYSHELASSRRAATAGRKKNKEKPATLPAEKPSDFPGPGEYKSNSDFLGPTEFESYTSRASSRKSPRCKFGSSARMAADAPRVTPGPDRYDTTNRLRNGRCAVAGSAPKWSFAGRSKDFALDGHVL